MINGFKILQFRFKTYFEKNRMLKINADIAIVNERYFLMRNNAATLIQKNFKAIHFNQQMSRFILICCIFDRNNFDERNWHATILQKRWRGFMVLLKLKRRAKFFKFQCTLATKIQSIYRKFYVRRQFIHYQNYMRSIFLRWSLLISGRQAVKLRMGNYVKPFQHLFRIHIFRHSRYYAAIKVQKVFRGSLCRKKINAIAVKHRIESANKIISMYKDYKLRKNRFFIVARTRMAAYKIEVFAIL
jgi:hypothetical protein